MKPLIFVILKLFCPPVRISGSLLQLPPLQSRAAGQYRPWYRAPVPRLAPVLPARHTSPAPRPSAGLPAARWPPAASSDHRRDQLTGGRRRVRRSLRPPLASSVIPAEAVWARGLLGPLRPGDPSERYGGSPGLGEGQGRPAPAAKLGDHPLL